MIWEEQVREYKEFFKPIDYVGEIRKYNELREQ
jgi:hypothetical protein